MSLPRASRLARRLGEYGVLLALAFVINFALPRVMPGGPLVALGGADVGQLSAQARADLLQRAGLDRPLVEQFFSYLGGVLRGDLGTSFLSRRPVVDEIAEALPWTLLLVGSALVLSTALGMAFGAVAGGARERKRDTGRLSFFLALDSLPPFWIGLLLILVFGVWLQWLPLFGATGLDSGIAGWDRVWSITEHLALPALTLVLASVGQTFLVMRYSMLSVLGQEFMEMTRAKGLGRRRILLRHAVPNAVLPVYTLVFLDLGWLIGGSVVVETVFSYPGLGRLTFDAVIGRDFPVLQGTFLVLTVTVIAMNLLADLTYPLIDPRLRHAPAEVN